MACLDSAGLRLAWLTSTNFLRAASRGPAGLAWLTSQNVLRAARRGPVDLAWLGVAHFKKISTRCALAPDQNITSICFASFRCASLGFVWLGLASLRLPWLGFTSLGLVGLLKESAGRECFENNQSFHKPFAPHPHPLTYRAELAEMRNELFLNIVHKFWEKMVPKNAKWCTNF